MWAATPPTRPWGARCCRAPAMAWATLSFKRLLSFSAFPYAWNDRHPARVGLLPKDGQASDIRWHDVDPCFVFHTCNAFDLPDGSVVMDVVAHRRMFDRSRQGPEMDSGA